MVNQIDGVNVGPPAAAAALGAVTIGPSPMASTVPDAVTVERIRKSRRDRTFAPESGFSAIVMLHLLLRNLGGAAHRVDDMAVSGAAAKIAVHRRDDLIV